MDLVALEAYVFDAFMVLLPGSLLGLLWLPALINDRRSAVSTIAWSFALVFLPYVGLLLFATLGHRRMTRRVRRKQRARDLMAPRLGEVQSVAIGAEPDASGFGLPEDALCRAIARAAVAMGAPLPTQGNTAVLLEDMDKFEQLSARIEAAEHHIHLEYYIFENDATGARIRDLLIERAKAGVEVRLLVDAVGSFAAGLGFLDALEDEGGHTAAFMPARLTGRRFDFNFRNHRKIAVIDGVVGLLGGINIADEHSGLGKSKGNKPWHDVHMEVRGPAVRALQETFAEDWYFATGEDLANTCYFPPIPPRGDVRMQMVTSGPDLEWPTLHQIYLTAIGLAQDSIWMMTPYFVPTESLLNALVAAAHRGVEVRLVLPSKLDHQLVYYAARSYYEELLRAGVVVMEYDARMIHAKVISVDGVFSMVGSCNLDVRSFYLNFEINALIYSEHVADALNAIIRDDMEDARVITLDAFSARSRLTQLAENAARLLSPML